MDKLVLKRLGAELSVCKLKSLDSVDLTRDLFFLARTDDEISLVCPSCEAPEDCLAKEDGWCGVRVEGILDFSLIGILASIADVLAKEKISMFAISTYNTDYILFKAANSAKAEEALIREGFVLT